MRRKTKQPSPSEGSVVGSGVKQKRCRAEEMRNFPGKREMFGEWWGNVSKHELYTVWRTMRARCLYSKSKEFHNYGGRGITICERWNFFPNFVEDMGTRPAGYQIERINNDGNYEPSNCKWATPSEQSNNRRVCHHLSFDGKRMTLTQWAKTLNVSKHLIMGRIRRGWKTEDILTKPSDMHPPGRGRKLTDSQAEFVRTSGLGDKELAERFSVHWMTIRKIKLWKRYLVPVG